MPQLRPDFGYGPPTLPRGHVEPVTEILQAHFQHLVEPPPGKLAVDQEGVIQHSDQLRQRPAGAGAAKDVRPHQADRRGLALQPAQCGRPLPVGVVLSQLLFRILCAVPFLQIAHGPIDGPVGVAHVAGVGMVGLDHGLVGGREDGVGANQVLDAFIDPRPVAVHAAGTAAAGRMAGVIPPGLRRLELLVAPETQPVILVGRSGPARTDGLVGVVAVDAAKLRETASLDGVAVLGGIPGGDPVGIGRPGPYVAAATGPVEVVVGPPEGDIPIAGIHVQEGAGGEKPGRFLAPGGHVFPASQVAGFTAHAQGGRMLRSLQLDQLLPHLQDILVAGFGGALKEIQDARLVLIQIVAQGEVQRHRDVTGHAGGIAGQHVSQRKGGVAKVAAAGVAGQEGLGGGRIEGVGPFPVGQLGPHVHDGHPLPLLQPVAEEQHVILLIEEMVAGFGALRLLADVVLEEARPDGLVHLVDSAHVAPLQPHLVVAAFLVKDCIPTEVGNPRLAGEIALDGGIVGQGVHPAMGVPEP